MGKKLINMKAGNLLAPVSSLAPPVVVTNVQHMSPDVGGSLDPISATILSLNSNPYLVGMMILLLNLGGRFLSLELTKKQEAFLQSPYIRPLLFFTVIFIATRNLVVAFWITLLFFFIIWVVANEHSPFCIIPQWSDENDK